MPNLRRTVTFECYDAGMVNASVYNMHGRVVATVNRRHGQIGRILNTLIERDRELTRWIGRRRRDECRSVQLGELSEHVGHMPMIVAYDELGRQMVEPPGDVPHYANIVCSCEDVLMRTVFDVPPLEETSDPEVDENEEQWEEIMPSTQDIRVAFDLAMDQTDVRGESSPGPTFVWDDVGGGDGV